MKIRLLGTGGADGIPGLFSRSRVSRIAREVGGKEIRTRSSALVDDGLKLDFPPDTFSQLVRDGLEAADWSGLVFTHSDDDHISTSQLQYALYPFTDHDHIEFAIYGNAAVIQRVCERYPHWPIELHLTESFVPFFHAQYGITPFRANHKVDEDSQNLLIESSGRSLIYATDTGIWPDETWEFLVGHRVDALVIECTEGFVPTQYHGHLDVEALLGVVDRLREMGVLTSSSQVVTTHHSHQGDATHCELQDRLCPHGIHPGYDGMVVEV